MEDSPSYTDDAATNLEKINSKLAATKRSLMRSVEELYPEMKGKNYSITLGFIEYEVEEDYD